MKFAQLYRTSLSMTKSEKKTYGSKYATAQIRPTPVCFNACKRVIFHAFISFERQEVGATPTSTREGMDMGRGEKQRSDSWRNASEPEEWER
jgi:hypothetical protein